MSEDAGDIYRRGVTDGTISQRLTEHDHHLLAINGSMEVVAAKLTSLDMSVQRMADSMDADRVTVVKTASALKDADDARRLKGDQRWSPLARVAAAAGTAAALLTAAAILLNHFHLDSGRCHAKL